MLHCLDNTQEIRIQIHQSVVQPWLHFQSIGDLEGKKSKVEREFKVMTN